MLHQLALPAITDALVERIAANDAVLLQHASVWAIWKGHQDNLKIQRLQDKGCQLYVLQDNLRSFGINPDQILAGIALIDYPAWVALTVENPVIMTWN